MRSVLIFPIVVFSAGVILFSCKKEFSCENCLPGNQPPVADAGKDTSVRIPDNTVVLNGNKSFDPDGSIKIYAWQKISGPDFYQLITPGNVTTRVEQLREGIYEFELTVTDDGGLSSKDTVQVFVTDPTIPNRAPVANAGPDKVVNNITGPVYLDGSASIDPDNNISGFLWTSISGPAVVPITSADQEVSTITISEAGSYQFELTVTDSLGLYSKDTIKIVVDLSVICSPDNRRIVNVRLVPVGKLSIGRRELASATAGSKILFAGGEMQNGSLSGRVDIFDFVTNTWEKLDLIDPERAGLATATLGNKIFLAGGGNNKTGAATAEVNIYDAATGEWSRIGLGQERLFMGAAAANNKVYFAGGIHWNNGIQTISDLVDIYDVNTKTISTSRLSEPKVFHSTNVVGNKIYFAGGQTSLVPMNISKKVEILDAVSNNWSTIEMTDARMFHAGIVFENRIFWAGGFKANVDFFTPEVEIKDLNTGLSTFNCIEARAQFEAVVKDKEIIFFMGDFLEDHDRMHIFNTLTGEWYIGQFNQKVSGAAIISANNKVYIAGGSLGLVLDSDFVYELEW